MKYDVLTKRELESAWYAQFRTKPNFIGDMLKNRHLVDERYLCDKCSDVVLPNNNAVYWQIMYDGILRGSTPQDAIIEFGANPLNLFAYGSAWRHLFPQEFPGACEGSPSRIAMINGTQAWGDGRRTQPRPLPPEQARAAQAAYECLRVFRSDPY